MKAPASSRSKVVTKAQKTKAAKGKSKGKKFTAAQKAQYNWLKQHYPFPKHSAVKKANSGNGGGGSVKVHPRTPVYGTKTTAVKRTLSLHHPHELAKGSDMKLGRNAPYTETERPRLSLDRYLTGAVAPAVVDYASEVTSWPMYGNDTTGDCTAACAGHEIQAWTRYTGAEVTVPEDEIIGLYSAVSGYDPATGANDNGASVQDVLTYWRKSGVPVAGHRILAFAQLTDLSKIHDALYIFGSVYLGINVPASAMDQFNADQPWDLVPGSQIEGGHAIPLQYAGTGPVPYQVVTWARLQGMTQAFLDTYCEEAWVVITDDWLDKNGHTPEGLDLQALGADLAALTGDPNPFPAPVPAPPAPVPPAPKPDPDPSLIQEIVHDAEQIIQDIEKVL